MIIKETNLNEVLLIKPRVFTDHRGFFLETFNQETYRRVGIAKQFVQDNTSRSTQNVLRGIHLQLPHAQGKLIRVARGAVFDVAVDLRKNSPSLGEWVGVILDDKDCHQLWIPPGFGHGFVALSATVDFEYKCTDFYHPQDEICIRWDDPDIGIKWPAGIVPIVSEKDNQGISFQTFCSKHL